MAQITFTTYQEAKEYADRLYKQGYDINIIKIQPGKFIVKAKAVKPPREVKPEEEKVEEGKGWSLGVFGQLSKAAPRVSRRKGIGKFGRAKIAAVPYIKSKPRRPRDWFIKTD